MSSHCSVYIHNAMNASWRDDRWHGDSRKQERAFDAACLYSESISRKESTCTRTL